MEFCLIGKKLGHSYSKIIHEKQGLCYSLVEIEEEGVENFIKNFDGGMNVTIPYKKAVIPYLDEVDGFAKEIGAVNTIVKIDGKLRGYNTDVFGMEYALKRARISLGGKRVMILGSGGTSLTARAVCKKNNASEVFVVSRSGEINYQNCYGYEVDVIINTTPVGMFPNEYDTPIDLSKFEGLEGVFDCIYNPLRTNLILQAQELGVKNSGGLAMLIAQGLKAEEIWLGISCLSVCRLAEKVRWQKNCLSARGKECWTPTRWLKIALDSRRPKLSKNTARQFSVGLKPRRL